MNFKENFNSFIPELTNTLSIPGSSDWTVKGFIDYYENIYSISTDTKVVSKIIELMIFPKFLEFANRFNYELKLSPHQNYYPDVTFIDRSNGDKYAVDLKSTYRITSEKVNGMTLGAFTGYFRNRTLSKNTLFPYGEYKEHYVFGVIYSRTDITKMEDYLLKKYDVLSISNTQRKTLITYLNENTFENWEKLVINFSKLFILTNEDKTMIDSYIIQETEVYNLDNFKEIQSVVKDFDFFIQEKWRIAIDRPGSGNTKNIGSESNIKILKDGDGLFFKKFDNNAKKVFDNYWINYETNDMSKKAGREKPHYNNIDTYLTWIKSLEI